MAGNGNGKDPVLVVVQLTGGNDFMNTVIPYTNPVYYDNRPTVGIPQDQVLPFTDSLAFHPKMGPFKEMYDAGDIAIVQGIGYPTPAGPTSGGWTYGTPASLTKYPPSAG